LKAVHLELLVEEASMEAFLRGQLPGILGSSASFEVYSYRGKGDLLSKLPDRLRGYAAWLPRDWRIVVIVDRDDQQCVDLKEQLEAIASDAGLISRSRADGADWQIANRIAIEELEAWYFGDWQAAVAAYGGLPSNVTSKAQFRDSDAISGGTWEAFERLLKRAGYFQGGLRKLDCARTMAIHFRADRCRSVSFQAFRAAILEAVSAETIRP
jgi:hypothetical protein